MMDTRHKIVSPERLQELVGAGRWTVLAGAFDPLTAEQVRRLAAAAAAGVKLAVIVETAASDPLLAPGARAILVAALRCVDAVAILEHAPAPVGSRVVKRDDAAERGRTKAFIDLVTSRQTGVPR